MDSQRIITFSSPIDAVDQLLEMLLEIPSSSVGNSLEKLIDSRISQAKDNAAERALILGNTLAETAKRSMKKLESIHNAESWTLPADLTVKVFSMLGTRSLCNAAATCYMLSKCANDSLCYGNIDLTSTVPKVNDALVCKFVQRAGQNLKSLKLGLLLKPNQESSTEISQYESYSSQQSDRKQAAEMSFLTRSCLFCLSMGDMKAGSLLKSLHLYNIDTINTHALCTALSACRSLLDLEVISLQINLCQTLECINSNCHLMERLVFKSSRTVETRSRDVSLKSKICHGLVKSCPNLSSFSLLGFKVNDHQARILMKGLMKLKFLDFSTSYSLTGSFLRNLGGPGYALEDLILRDCPHLKETKVACFLAGLLAGDFKFLKILDFSNKNGLAASLDCYERCYDKSNLPLAQVEEERPGLVIHADFPFDQRFEDFGEMENSDFGDDSELFGLDSCSEISEYGSLHEVSFTGFLESVDGLDSDYDFMW